MTLKDELEKVYEWWLVAAGDRLVDSLEKNGVVFSGGSASELAGSIEVNLRGGKQELLMFDYWEIVDQGRRPGNVSDEGYEKIKRWVNRKGERKLAARFKITEKDLKKRIEAIATIVRRKVQNKGYEGVFFVDEAITQAFVDELGNKEAEVIAEFLTDELNDNNT